MASRTNESCDMRIRVEIAAGDNVTYKNRTLKYWNPRTTDSDFLTWGNAIGALQTHVVSEIIRLDTATLESD